jgi:sortase A
VRIQIPALNIDAPIVQGDGWEQLMKGVGQHIGTANPGEKGNMVLSGHNDEYGEVFRYLDRLKAGDEIIVFTFTSILYYIVEGWDAGAPDQVEVMNPNRKRR